MSHKPKPLTLKQQEQAQRKIIIKVMAGDRKLFVAARLRGIADMQGGPLNLDGRMILMEAADLLSELGEA